MPKSWTFISVEDEKETPPEALEAREDLLATWLARIFLAEQEVGATSEGGPSGQQEAERTDKEAASG